MLTFRPKITQSGLFVMLLLLVACATDANMAAKPTAKSPIAELRTIEVTVTEAPELAPTATPTTQIMPTATGTAVPVPTVSPFLQGPLIAFDAIDATSGQDAILIFDTETSVSREITSQQLGGTIVGFDWSANGCNLFVALQSEGNVQYVQTSLDGKILDSVTQPISRSAEEESRFGWTMSSTQEWIAVLTGFGEDEEGFDFEFKDTWTIRIGEEPETLIALTQNSYTSAPTWSPNGERLAFSNRDATGILQLYHTAPDGSDLVQLTHFSEPIARIEGIRWSPNNQWLTFATFNIVSPMAPGESALWSVAVNGQTLQQVDTGNYIIRQAPWWSANSESYSAYAELWSTESSSGFQGGKVIWVNPQTGEIFHEFTPTGIQFEHIFPVAGNSKVGFLGATFTVYDEETETTMIRGQSPFGPFYATKITPSVAPYHFPGEENCP